MGRNLVQKVEKESKKGACKHEAVNIHVSVIRKQHGEIAK